MPLERGRVSAALAGLVRCTHLTSKLVVLLLVRSWSGLVGGKGARAWVRWCLRLGLGRCQNLVSSVFGVTQLLFREEGWLRTNSTMSNLGFNAHLSTPCIYCDALVEHQPLTDGGKLRLECSTYEAQFFVCANGASSSVRFFNIYSRGPICRPGGILRRAAFPRP